MTVVPTDEQIDDHLRWMLDSGEPGGCLHHLVVDVVPSGPLGLPSDKIETHVSALALGPEQEGRPDTEPTTFMRRSIAATAVRHTVAKETMVFVALARAGWMVLAKTDEEWREVERLQAAGRLQEHPAVVEVMCVYGACRDGRRWFGMRTLTGARAGEQEGPALLDGPVSASEAGPALVEGKMLRRMVGIDA